MTVEVEVSEAAALLGVSRDTIRRRIRAYRKGNALEAPILGARRDDRGRWLLELDREAGLDPETAPASIVRLRPSVRCGCCSCTVTRKSSV